MTIERSLRSTVRLRNDGQPVLVDAGVETYTAKTFSSQRYDIMWGALERSMTPSPYCFFCFARRDSIPLFIT